LKDAAALDSYFEKALKGGNEPYLARLDYARGLSLLEDPRAEKWYGEAMAVEPEGLADAVAYYAEWLLDHGREAEVVDLVRDDIRVEYVHFLKGVALERLGQPEEARREYEHYRRLNAAFPAPVRYRVTGSEAQAGLGPKQGERSGPWAGRCGLVFSIMCREAPVSSSEPQAPLSAKSTLMS
jgi:tetratricopeptide (TPR) repeat protein